MEDVFVEMRHGLEVWLDAGTGNEYVAGETPPDGVCPVCNTELENEVTMSSSDSAFDYWLVCRNCGLAWYEGKGPAC